MSVLLWRPVAIKVVRWAHVPYPLPMTNNSTFSRISDVSVGFEDVCHVANGPLWDPNSSSSTSLLSNPFVCAIPFPVVTDVVICLKWSRHACFLRAERREVIPAGFRWRSPSNRYVTSAANSHELRRFAVASTLNDYHPGQHNRRCANISNFLDRTAL